MDVDWLARELFKTFGWSKGSQPGCVLGHTRIWNPGYDCTLHMNDLGAGCWIWSFCKYWSLGIMFSSTIALMFRPRSLRCLQ